MTTHTGRVARYTVIIERTLDDTDYNVSGVDAARQLAEELQEAWDRGIIAGFFQVVGRRIEGPNRLPLIELGPDKPENRHNFYNDAGAPDTPED